MINYTGYDNAQNCYVDMAAPYNPWGYRYPYIGDVPRPPYRITDAPSTPWNPWQPLPNITITYPPTTIQTTGTTAPTLQAEPTKPTNDTPTPDDAPDEDHSADLADMIREIVRDELSKIQYAEKSTKGIARDVLKLIKDELRMQGTVTRL